MSLTIDLSPDDERRGSTAATIEGVPPAELARKLLSEHLLPKLSKSEEQDPTLALSAQWDAEDSRMTPVEVEEARLEFEEFKQHINSERRRANARIIYA